jgi:hypothetical protein
MGFFDATCKCGKRIGWSGEYKDRPPCPKCGAPAPELDPEEERAIAKMEAEILKRMRELD